MMKAIRETFIKHKICFYYGYQTLSGAGLGFLVADGLSKYYPFNLIPLPVLFLCGFIGVWGFGYILWKFRFYDVEQSFMTKNNSELIARLEEAKKGAK